MRLLIVASHPVQYQAPWFRELAKVVDLTVFFCHRQDARGQADAGFGVAFDWDVPLLDGYRHEWLHNVSVAPGVDAYGGCDTPGVDAAVGDGHFDACIVSGWYLKSYVQAIRACRRHGVPVLLRGDSQLATRRSPVWSALKLLPYRWFLGRVDAHLYVGERNREYLRHYGVKDDRLFHVPHFVDNQFFSTLAGNAREDGHSLRIRREAGAGAHSRLFMFAGKLIAKKRPADFVEALALVRRSGLDARGLIVGSGHLETGLRHQVSELGVPVTFAGFRNQSEMPAYYAAADALVMPSDAGETWGLVVNEAMACGIPALVSNAAGCAPDLIVDGETGFVFHVGDVQALAERMTNVDALLSGHSGAVSRAIDARISRYSVEGAVSGTLRAIESIATRRGPQKPRGDARVSIEVSG